MGYLVTACVLATWVHLTGMAVAAWVSGAKQVEVSIGLGPRLVRWNGASWQVQIRLLPLGGYVSLGRNLLDVPASRMVGVVLDGNVLLVALAFLLLRDAGVVWTEFAGAYVQVGRGVVEGAGYGAPLLTTYAQRFATEGLGTAVGVVALKFAALNLLPLPTQNGGQALVSLIHARWRLSPGAHGWLGTVGLVVMLPIVLRWLYIVGNWAWSGE